MTERANAIKGYKTSKGVLLDDLSPVKHKLKIKLSGEDVSDFSDSKVYVQGKNLFNYRDWIDYCNSGIGSSGNADDTYLGRECFSYIQKRDAGTDPFAKIKFKENTRYTISMEYSFSYSGYESYSMPCLIVVYSDGQQVIISKAVPSTAFTRIVYTSEEGKTVRGIALARFSSSSTIYVDKNMQIEEGIEPTEFEPYIAPVEHTVQADGSVEGVESWYPSMNIYTDGELTVSAEYNRDANKVVAELTRAIISLGGNV